MNKLGKLYYKILKHSQLSGSIRAQKPKQNRKPHVSFC